MSERPVKSLSVRRKRKSARKPARNSRVRNEAKGLPAPAGWKTSDDDEVALRRWRGTTEIVAVEALETVHPWFGTFRVRSASGSAYEVEIRSLTEFSNSCGCIDHRVNGLGTCKHIEGVIEWLARKRPDGTRATESPRIEVFLDRRASPPAPAVAWPKRGTGKRVQAAREWLGGWLTADGALTADPVAIEALIAARRAASAEVAGTVRVSRHFSHWLDRARRERERVEARAAFAAEVAAGRDTLDIVKFPLLPYQRDGVLHLAFGERALLADEMGLGKTVQGIAACVLLAKRRGFRRVLVVCPASLKAEWEEQIARFCDLPARLVFGPRAQRLAAYRDPAFFTIVNYEQVLSDADDINATLRPDIVVLDEAQRIKNWQTKTARRVKSLRSPCAFVLTGTPLENRIDEVYSIVQYLDPEILGPLFRFNRDFYRLDERGRPVDYQNLAGLRARLEPVLLRRRKCDVESELPGRTVKTYFVPMADEQKLRYADYEFPARQLLAKAQKRALLPQEFEKLQMLLACMRMICDTPAILDPDCRISPKLEELEGILGDLLEDPDRKVIIFSEWERMLVLVRELAGDMGVDVAWHTGSVSQPRRRAEINRFKHDPACRLFLSTDSGSVGLNLQVASAVVNVDLPWNPAKLEQRIARAWRKNQMRTVNVINLVTQDSIEHNILHLLGRKQALADGVIDGVGDLATLTMPSGRAAFVERMQAVMAASAGPAPRPRPPEDIVVADLVERHGDKVLLAEARIAAEGRVTLLVVLDLDPEAFAAEKARLATVEGVDVDVLDSTVWLAMQRFAASGLLQFTHQSHLLHRSAALAAPERAPAERGRDTDSPAPRPAADGAALVAEAQRMVRKARLLASGGFPEDVPALLAMALRKIAAGMAHPSEDSAAAPASWDADIGRLVKEGALPAAALAVVSASQPGAAAPTADAMDALVAAAEQVVAALEGDGGGGGEGLVAA